MNIHASHHLPQPDAGALEHSEQLKTLIAKEISEAGPMTFARYMQLALYAPGLGYYNSGKQKFGKNGDFITAPELSPLFAQCLGRQCAQALQIIGGGNILEFGAGSGIMAADILLELEKLHCLPEHYYILEVSPDLKQQQHQTLLNRAPTLLERVQWINQLPSAPFTGVILANEVLDAMPAHRFYCDDKQIQEYFVTLQENQFMWDKSIPSDTLLRRQIEHLQKEYLGSIPYSSEINLLITPWIAAISTLLKQGLILLIDYGFPRQEYYHPDRNQGTLMCHYRHRAHSDPFLFVGLQDITCHVDFTTIAEAAQSCGLTLSGYTNQASFLIGSGLADILQTNQYHSELEQFNANQQVKLLTSPSEMGELFKVMSLTRQLDHSLLGFSFQNKLHRL